MPSSSNFSSSVCPDIGMDNNSIDTIDISLFKVGNTIIRSVSVQFSHPFSKDADKQGHLAMLQNQTGLKF